MPRRENAYSVYYTAIALRACGQAARAGLLTEKNDEVKGSDFFMKETMKRADFFTDNTILRPQFFTRNDDSRHKKSQI
jgi:hypothetical protein